MSIYILLFSSIFALLIIDRFKILPSVKVFRKKNDCRSNLFDSIIIQDNKNRNVGTSFILATIILFSFTAFRFDVGWDYMAYYNTIKYNVVTNIISNGEYFNIFLIKISNFFALTNFYFFVNAFILFYLVVKTIKSYSMDPWLSLILFISFPLFYLNSLSVIRLFTALAISFYGFKHIKNKKFVYYVLTIIIASMFHKSAIIAFAFYFLKNIKLKRHKLMLIFILLPFISTIINNLVVRFFPRYAAYTKITTGQEGTKAIIIFLALGIVCMLLRSRITKNDCTANIYFNLFYVGLCIYLMFFKQGTMGHRLSLYGTIYSLLLVPKLVSLLKSKKEQMLIKALIYVFCILAFLFTIYVGAETYIPYTTIWEKY